MATHTQTHRHSASEPARHAHAHSTNTLQHDEQRAAQCFGGSSRHAIVVVVVLAYSVQHMLCSWSHSGSRILLLAAIGRESKVISAAQSQSAVRCAVLLLCTQNTHTHTVNNINTHTQTTTYSHAHFQRDQSIESDLMNSIVDYIRKRIHTYVLLPVVVCIVRRRRHTCGPVAVWRCVSPSTKPFVVCVCMFCAYTWCVYFYVHVFRFSVVIFTWPHVIRPKVIAIGHYGNTTKFVFLGQLTH